MPYELGLDEYFGSWRGTEQEFQGLSTVAWRGTDKALELHPESSEEDEEDEDSDEERCHGLRQCNPELYVWLMDRIGAPADIAIIVVFVVIDGVAFVMDEAMWNSKVNVSCMFVFTNLLSLVVSLAISFCLEGSWVVKKIFNFHVLWRFFIAALFFYIASRLDADAYKAGTKPIVVKTLGYTYLPLSAIASWVLFRRGYGRLEWLSLLIMALAMAAFSLLRERCREGSCEGEAYHQWPAPVGVCLVFSGVLLSCTASLYCERIYKNSSFGLRRWQGMDHNRYSIHKVHLDFCSLVIAISVWCCPIQIKQSLWGVPSSTSWFGTWTKRNYLYIPVQVLHYWMVGLVAKRYSTVTKAVLQTLATSAVIMLEDPLFYASKFSQVMVPSLFIFVIVVLSALMFQTGRLNIAIASASYASDKVVRISAGLGHALTDFVHRQQEEVETKDQEKFNLTGVLLKYTLIILYVLADATRTMLYTVSVGKSMITPQSFSVAMNGAMLCLSNVLLYTKPPEGQSGGDAVREAWRLPKLVKFLPCGFLFALTSALMSMAMGMGISGSLSVVIGKIYLPICAIASRCLLGKYYMWLEWFALVILTLSSVVFGYLKSFNVTDANGLSKDEPIAGMLLVLASAATSAVGSLVTEKILKGEQVPFHLQKVRLDMGSILSSFVLLPAIGMIATRPQDIPWAQRPTSYGTCPWDSVCWQKPHSNHSCSNPDCHCDCERGIFAGWDLGWDSWVLVFAVLVNTTQGWLVGKVTQRFSVVHRAIADSFSLLTIYFVGDPIFNHTSLANVSLNLVAFIVPLSTATFSVATSEMQKVFQAQTRLGDRYETALGRGRLHSELDSDSESELSELSNGFSIAGSRAPSRPPSPSKPLRPEGV
mmetsp:Transcript_61862/g.149772  ORF Transcript_61862/g.149772 Transcript_61862/m.149772 type:complete len:876 (-) Transcript_61862:57-2684(-)